MKKKYIIQCRYCGKILFKTTDLIFHTLEIETKCPDCGRILAIPIDTVIELEKKKLSTV